MPSSRRPAGGRPDRGVAIEFVNQRRKVSGDMAFVRVRSEAESRHLAVASVSEPGRAGFPQRIGRNGVGPVGAGIAAVIQVFPGLSEGDKRVLQRPGVG